MALTQLATDYLRQAIKNLDAATEIQNLLEGEAAQGVQDDVTLYFGDGDDAGLLWSTADASNHSFVVALDDTNQSLHVTDKGAKATDWNVSANTHPTLYVHSNTTPATDYLLIGGHDGTTAGLDVAG